MRPKVTDITIRKVFEVTCEMCGGTVIDVQPAGREGYLRAIRSRREHFFGQHWAARHDGWPDNTH